MQSKFSIQKKKKTNCNLFCTSEWCVWVNSFCTNLCADICYVSQNQMFQVWTLEKLIVTVLKLHKLSMY